MSGLEWQPTVSIVTPSLNQGAFIEETIRSVREQDYPRIEHIVVDGGSTDGTLDILARQQSLTWISQPDEGQADAINKGFALATGQVLAWLNSDDLYLPGGVRKAVNALDETGAMMVYANLVEIDETGKELGRSKARVYDRERLIERGNSIPQPTVFFRRELLDAVGGLDTRYQYAMDFDLWLRAGAHSHSTPVYVDDYWAAFRRHPTSKTDASEPLRFLREVRQISRAHGGRRPLSEVEITTLRAEHRLLGAAAFRLRRMGMLLRKRELRALGSDLAGIPTRLRAYLRERRA